MTTAEALEAMTDAGQFEILATRVLRLEDADCGFLEHVGVNATGKTIPNPIDSFCIVPGSDPPRFIMAAFTTDSPDKLERKWRFDHTMASPGAKKKLPANDGDLIKASRRAREIRRDYPNATFVVHLCTNRRLSDDLMTRVYQHGQALGLEVRFLGQSRIRDCLDMRPEGQWLRKQHLNISADLLSLHLLTSLSQNSLELYGQDILLMPPHTFVATAAVEMLRESIGSSHLTVHVITGGSGTGKSVAAYLVLRDHIESGSAGLWIPAEIAARASSLEEAIELTLRALYPAIQNGAGGTALRLASPQNRLLLVVDDVSRSGHPTAVIKKVLTWGKPLSSAGKDAASHSAWSIIVPTWDVYWAPLEPLYKTHGWLVGLSLGRMSKDDAVLCVRQALGQRANAFSDAQLSQITTALGYDPILIGLFARLFENGADENVNVTAHEVMEKFISSAVSEVAALEGYLKADYQEGLLSLGRAMLIHRELYPGWADIVAWLPDRPVQALSRLAHQGHIARMADRTGGARFEFRHDRILEHHLSNVLCTMLADPARHADVLSDPFYATMLGRAITTVPPSDTTLAWIKAHSPLALIAAIRFIPTANDVYTSRIGHVAKKWLCEASRDRNTPLPILNESYRLLEETESSIVLEVTNSLPAHPSLGWARFANGDFAAGISVLAARGRFIENIKSSQVKAALEKALRRHRDSLVEGCGELLRRSGMQESTTVAALTLAGMMAANELAEPIHAAWDSCPDKVAILVYTVWAACRCGGESPATILDPMMAVWSSLSDEREGVNLSPRKAIAENLRLVMSEAPEPVLRYLVDTATRSEALRYVIAHMLERVDHPVAVAFMVSLAAELEQAARQKNSFSHWVWHLKYQWDPQLYDGRRLSNQSVDAIRALWESQGSDAGLQKTAFTFWATAVDDLDPLQAIPLEHPQFAVVLRRRARLGDFTAVQHIKPLLTAGSLWFHDIHRVWCSEFMEAIDNALAALRDQTPPDFSGGTSDDHYMLGELLRDIPNEDAEKLLRKHWNHLRYSPLFVQAAFYIGTVQSIDLANAVIDEYPSNRCFAHITQFFGFRTFELDDRLSSAHLDALRPHLKRLEMFSIHEMVEFCVHHGYRDWMDQYLHPELERRRADTGLDDASNEDRKQLDSIVGRYFPSDTDLLVELDVIEQQTPRDFAIWHWCERFDGVARGPDRWRSALDRWLQTSPSLSRLQIVGLAIMYRGTREDLDLLIKHHIDGAKEAVETVVAGVRFAVMRRTLN